MEWSVSFKKLTILVFFLCVFLNALILHLPIFHNHYSLLQFVQLVENDTIYVRDALCKTFHELQERNLHKDNQNESTDFSIVYDFVIFTSFEPTAKRYIAYNNTKHNWPSLSSKVKAVLFTNNSVLADEFRKEKWDVLPLVHVSKSGTPVLKYMYIEVAKRYNAHFIGFSNADILFTNGLAKSFKALREHNLFNSSHVMAAGRKNGINLMTTGRRTNIMNLTAEEAKSFSSLVNTTRKRGVLFRADAEDYFFTTRFYPWEKIPDLVIGRVAYDNFLLLHARMLNISTIDLTQTVAAIHQTVDKGHLEEKWKLTDQEKHYNNYVIKKKFRHINYYAGMTNCLNFETKIKDKVIVLNKRDKLSNYCGFRTSEIIHGIIKSKHPTPSPSKNRTNKGILNLSIKSKPKR